MKYENPEIKFLKFSVNSFLGDDLLSAFEHEGISGGGSGSGEGGGSNIDDTNLGDIGHEILNNIFGP